MEIATNCRPQSPASSGDFSIVSGDRARDLGAETPLSEKQSLDTPQAASQDAGGIRTPGGNDESDSRGFRVYSKRRQSRGRSAESLSLSCPPLGRVIIGSVKRKCGGDEIQCQTMEDSTLCPKIISVNSKLTSQRLILWNSRKRKRQIVINLDYNPACQKKVRRRRYSMPEHGEQHSLPEDYIHEQQAHFAEIDAFELEEGDASDSN